MATVLFKKGMVLGIICLFIGASVLPQIVPNMKIPIVKADDLDDGLVAYWNFDEGTGSIAHDSSGNSNDGTINGASRTTGISGNALSFDGNDDYVDCGNDASLNPINEITVEAWYKPVSFSGMGNNAIIDKGYGSHVPPYYQYHLGVNGDTYGSPASFGFSVSAGGTSYVAHTGSNFWTVDNWYHLVGVYDGSKVELYVNGNLIASNPASGNMTNYGKNVYIGKFSNIISHTPGTMDEVKIYNRALNEDEIKDHYFNTGLVGYWSFDEGSGSTAYDSSGNENDGTINGATWTTGVSGNALSFDGVDDYVSVADTSSLDISVDLTMIAWIKLPSSKLGTIMNKGNSWGFCTYSDGRFGSQNSHISAGQILSPDPLSSDTWYHVAYIYDGSIVRIFLNGEEVNSVPSTGIYPLDDWPLHIGANSLYIFESTAFLGIIDEVRVYNIALNEDEILDLYNQGGENQLKYQIEQDGNTWDVIPIVRDQDAVSFYDYNSMSGHTPFMEAFSSKIYLYRDLGSDELSLVVHHSMDNDGSSSQHIDFDFTDVPEGVFVAQSDEPDVGSPKWEFDLTKEPEGNWQYSDNSDGGVLSGFPLDESWCISINPNFDDADGVGAPDIFEWVYQEETNEILLDMTKQLVLSYNPSGNIDTIPPSKITDLTHYGITDSSVTIQWTAPGDDDTTGTASYYDIRYKTSPINEDNWDTSNQASFEPSPNPAGASELFTVTNLNPGTTYYFAMKTGDEIPNWSELSNCVDGTTTNTGFQELVSYWAPVWYQDTDTGDYTVDCITSFNYDGNWRGNDNWEHLDDGYPLKAYVYYWMVETQTHWFIGYADFHPRDCKPGLEHENDLEGVLLVIQKDGSEFGKFLLMITLSHLNFYSYTDFDTLPSSNVGDGNKPVLGDVEFQGSHPIVYVDSQGHAVSGDYRWENNGFPGGDGIIYIPSDNAEVPESGNDDNIGYELLDINGLYENANDFTYRFESWGVFNSPDDYWKANAPWMWDDKFDDFPPGSLFYDPVSLVDMYHTGLGSYDLTIIYRSYDSVDVMNPLLAEEQTGFDVMVELENYYQKIESYVSSNINTVIGLADPFMGDEERQVILGDLADGFPKPDFVEDIEETISMFNHFIDTIINEDKTLSFTPHPKGIMIDFHSYKYLIEDVSLPDGVNEIILDVVDNGVEVTIVYQEHTHIIIGLEKLKETVDGKETDMLKVSFTIDNMEQNVRLDMNLYICFSHPIGAFSEITLDHPDFLIKLIFNDPFSLFNQYTNIGAYLGFSLDGYAGVGGGVDIDGGMFVSGKSEEMDVITIIDNFNSCLNSNGGMQWGLDIDQMMQNVFTIGDCTRSSIPDSSRIGGEFGISGKLGLGAGGSAGVAGAKASVDGKGTLSASGSIPVPEFVDLVTSTSNMDLYIEFLVSCYESIQVLFDLDINLDLENMGWWDIYWFFQTTPSYIARFSWDLINAFLASNRAAGEILNVFSEFLLDKTIVTAQLETGLGAGAAAGLELGGDVALIPGAETNLRTLVSLFALDFNALADKGYFGVYVKRTAKHENNIGPIGIKTVYSKDIFKATIQGKDDKSAVCPMMEDWGKQDLNLSGFMDDGVDIDADGLYNHLRVNFTADFPTKNQYSIIAMLYDNLSCIGSSMVNISYDMGLQPVSLLFDGLHLRNQMVNGTYALGLIICNYDTDEILFFNYDIYNTSWYDYTDFQSSSTIISDISVEGWDMNGNMLYDYLFVNASVDMDDSEEVHIISTLQSDGFILQNESSMMLSSGLNTVSCLFDGTVIRQSGVDSPYQFNLVIYNGSGIRIARETFPVDSFLFSDFEMLNCSLSNDFMDYGVDIDGDGFFDYLVVDVGVNVSVPGLYSVSLDLVGNDSVFSVSNTSYLNSDGYVSLHVDGALIRDTGINQSYQLRQIVLSGNSVIFGARDYMGTTSVWNASDFSFPKACLTEEYVNYTVDEDDDGFADHLVVDVGVQVFSADVYKISGFLDCNGSSVYAENYKYLTAGFHEVKLWFDGMSISEIGQQEWYRLVDVGLLMNGSFLVMDDVGCDIVLNVSDFTGFVNKEPVVSGLFPLNDSLFVSRPPSCLNFSLMDDDLHVMAASLYWLDHDGVWTCLESFEDVIDGVFSFSDLNGSDWLWGNTIYTWSVNVTDGITWTNKTYRYTTGDSRYDVNNNDIVNFQDAGLVWIHRTSEVDYDGIYDVNQNGVVNFQDAGLTWVNRD